MTKAKIKTIEGRVKYIGGFEYGEGRTGTKIVLELLEDSAADLKAEVADVVIFRQGLQEYARGLVFKAGKLVEANDRPFPGDLCKATGEYQRRKRTDRKGWNHSVQLKNKDDLTWQPLDIEMPEMALSRGQASQPALPEMKAQRPV